MAGTLYFKSIVWLISIGGLGYGLMLLTEPSAEKLEQIRASASSTHLSEDEKKKLLFMKRLQEAATDPEPIYLKNKRNN